MTKKIILAVSQAAGVGGHYYWIKTDGQGNPVSQIHGFALVNGQISTTALSGVLHATSQYGYGPEAIWNMKEVLVDSDALVDSLWEGALQCVAEINALNLAYDWASSAANANNSNAVAATIAACMGQEMSLSTMLLTPGSEDILLSPARIQSILNASTQRFYELIAGGVGGGGGGEYESPPGEGGGEITYPIIDGPKPGGYWQPVPEQKIIDEDTINELDGGVLIIGTVIPPIETALFL